MAPYVPCFMRGTLWKNHFPPFFVLIEQTIFPHTYSGGRKNLSALLEQLDPSMYVQRNTHIIDRNNSSTASCRRTFLAPKTQIARGDTSAPHMSSLQNSNF